MLKSNRFYNQILLHQSKDGFYFIYLLLRNMVPVEGESVCGRRYHFFVPPHRPIFLNCHLKVAALIMRHFKARGSNRRPCRPAQKRLPALVTFPLCAKYVPARGKFQNIYANCLKMERGQSGLERDNSKFRL